MGQQNCAGLQRLSNYQVTSIIRHWQVCRVTVKLLHIIFSVMYLIISNNNLDIMRYMNHIHK